jgi:hypothetical protein
MPQPRKKVAQPKSKEEVVSELKRKANIDHQRVTARLIFPFLEGLPTVYDAQTAVNAAAGYIRYDLQRKQSALKVTDLDIDLTKEKATVLKTAVEHILSQLSTENAEDAASILELMGNKLPQHVSLVGMKEPMSTVKMDDFIA